MRHGQWAWLGFGLDPKCIVNCCHRLGSHKESGGGSRGCLCNTAILGKNNGQVQMISDSRHCCPPISAYSHQPPWCFLQLPLRSPVVHTSLPLSHSLFLPLSLTPSPPPPPPPLRWPELRRLSVNLIRYTSPVPLTPSPPDSCRWGVGGGEHYKVFYPHRERAGDGCYCCYKFVF